MTTFAIIAPGPREDLTHAIKASFGDNSYEYAPGQFVVTSPNLTTQGVGTEIGANGEVGQVVVFAVASYWGYHKHELWEWLMSHTTVA